MWPLFNQKACRSEPCNIKALRRVVSSPSTSQKKTKEPQTSRRSECEECIKAQVAPGWISHPRQPPSPTLLRTNTPSSPTPHASSHPHKQNWATGTFLGLVTPCLTGLAERRETLFQAGYLSSCNQWCLLMVFTWHWLLLNKVPQWLTPALAQFFHSISRENWRWKEDRQTLSWKTRYHAVVLHSTLWQTQLLFTGWKRDISKCSDSWQFRDQRRYLPILQKA